MKTRKIFALAMVSIFTNTMWVHGQIGIEQVLTEKRHKPVCTAFSSDSKLLASGSTNNEIFIWSLETKSVVKRLVGLDNFPISVAFSHNNKYLVSGGKDHEVTIWNIANQSKQRVLKGHSNNVLSVDISPDDKYIVSGSIDKTIVLWKIETGAYIRVFKGHRHQVNSVCFNFDGTKILSAGADKKIIEWNVNTGEIIRTFSEAHRNWIRRAYYSPDGRFIVSCSDDTYVKIWNNHTGELVNTIRAHKDDVYTLSFSPDGKYIVTGGHDKRLVVIEVETGLIVFQSGVQDNYILSVAFAPDGKNLASAVLYSDELKLWDVEELNISSAQIADASVSRAVAVEKLARPEIYCISPYDSISRTQKGIFPFHVSFVSESKISKIDLLKDNKLFSSYLPEDLRTDSLGVIHLERNIFLTEGANNIKIKLQTEDGQLASTQRILSYSLPKRPELLWGTSLNDTMETNTQIFALDNTIHSPSNLKSLTLYNNDKPVYNQKDVNVSPDSNIFHLKREIALYEGENKVKLVVENVGGISESEILTVFYSPQKTEIEVIIPPAKPNPYRFALIIGNEDYSSYQVGLESESDVAYAKNDATEFRKYAIKYLGVPEDQAILKLNSRYIEMRREIKKIQGIMELTNGKAEIFFYYAGHGFPHEKTKEPYLIPVDGSGTDLEFSAIKLNDLYDDLSKYPSARVTVFLDACFSGGGRNKGIVEARGVKVKPKEANVSSKMVVFSAASDNQTSMPYAEKEHGIFTYYVLKKIDETGGLISYKELSDYVIEQVGIKSYLINSKKQVPETNASPEINGIWQEWRLR